MTTKNDRTLMKCLSENKFWSVFIFILFSTGLMTNVVAQPARQTVKSLYIPLADHYAALVAYERYRGEMKHANFQIQQMKNWDLLRAYFQSGEVDMAYVMSPLAMDMFNEQPYFRWVGLMHRDGNALAINELLNNDVKVSSLRSLRKPDTKVALALKKAYRASGHSIQIGMPHLLSTHSVVLYRYLKENGLGISFGASGSTEVQAIAVAPPKSPVFIKKMNSRNKAAAFEQSLPWADIVEAGGFGYIAWYSKDVMPWQFGHVECIVLATDKAISEKFEAIKEVNYYLHKAGKDIEAAREVGGKQLDEIVAIVRKHIPAHTREAIIASLNPDLRVINYQHMNIDKSGLKLIMDFAVEGGIIKTPVDLDAFSDERFSTDIGREL